MYYVMFRLCEPKLKHFGYSSCESESLLVGMFCIVLLRILDLYYDLQGSFWWIACLQLHDLGSQGQAARPFFIGIFFSLILSKGQGGFEKTA